MTVPKLSTRLIHPARLVAWTGLLAMLVLGFGLSAQFLLSTPEQELSAPCPTLNQGDRFKVTGHNAVYLLNDELRRLYFPHSDVYHS